MPTPTCMAPSNDMPHDRYTSCIKSGVWCVPNNSTKSMSCVCCCIVRPAAAATAPLPAPLPLAPRLSCMSGRNALCAARSLRCLRTLYMQSRNARTEMGFCSSAVPVSCLLAAPEALYVGQELNAVQLVATGCSLGGPQASTHLACSCVLCV